MKFVDEFRDAELGRAVAMEIMSLVEPGRHYKLMEVCGGHTHSIYKYGIDDLLPANVELVHGPGCPVCVIPMGRVDDGIAIAHTDGVIFTCFGDMMRVPGSEGSLLEAKAAGADIRMVYSPLDALRIAKQNPDREVVFFAIGFETTAPSTALTLKRARAERRRELLGHVHPRDDRAAAAGAARVARSAPRRVHRAGPRLDRGGRAPVPVHPGRLRQAGRDRRFRAARHPPGDRDDPPAARRRALRRREPVQARGPLRGQPARARGDGRGVRAPSPLRVARARLHLPQRPAAVRRLRRPRRRGSLQRPRRPRRRPEGVPVRRGAQGRDQALGVQGVRNRLYAGAPDRHLHGLLRGGVRRLLQLRAVRAGAGSRSDDRPRGRLGARTEDPRDHRDGTGQARRSSATSGST